MRRHEREGATCVLQAVGGRLLAAFAVCDPLKPEAPAVVAAIQWVGWVGRLAGLRGSPIGPCTGLQQPLDTCTRPLACRRQGVRCHLVTGDCWATARAIAARLGISDVSAEVGWQGTRCLGCGGLWGYVLVLRGCCAAASPHTPRRQALCPPCYPVTY